MTTPTTPIAGLVISGATVVGNAATFEGSVAFKDVRIMALGETRAMPAARDLMSDTKGWGQSVRRIQRMPPPQPRNTDQTLAAVTGAQGK